MCHTLCAGEYLDGRNGSKNAFVQAHPQSEKSFLACSIRQNEAESTEHFRRFCQSNCKYQKAYFIFYKKHSESCAVSHLLGFEVSSLTCNPIGCIGCKAFPFCFTQTLKMQSSIRELTGAENSMSTPCTSNRVPRTDNPVHGFRLDFGPIKTSKRGEDPIRLS